MLRGRKIALALLFILFTAWLMGPYEIAEYSGAVDVADGVLSDWENASVTFDDPTREEIGNPEPTTALSDLTFVGFDSNETWLFVRWDIINDGKKDVLYDMGINRSGNGGYWDIYVTAQVETVGGVPILTNVSIRDANDNHLWNASDDGDSAEDGNLFLNPELVGGEAGTIAVEARFPKSVMGLFGDVILGKFQSHSSITVTSVVKDICPNDGFSVYNTTSGAWGVVTNPNDPFPASFFSEKNVYPSKAVPGIWIQWNITFNNIGELNSSTVWINETLPFNTTYLSDDAGSLLGNGALSFTRTIIGWTPSGYNISYEFANVTVGDHCFHINSTVNSTAGRPDALTNRYILDWEENPGKPLIRFAEIVLGFDTQPPELTGLNDNPDPQNAGDYVEITIYVIDDFMVDTVWVNITYPDSTWVNVSMTPRGGDEWFYNVTYIDLGLYSYIVYANDTSDIWNDTGPGTFTIQDTKGPEFNDLCDTPDPQEPGGFVNITVDVTDYDDVNEVWVNITYPNGSWTNVSMLRGTGDEWFYNNTYGDLGDYTYLVWANDTYNNCNCSISGTFMIKDIVAPELSDPNATPDFQENGGYVNITVNVTDNVGVDTVWINITHPNGSWINISMSPGIADDWFYDSNYNDLGFYTYTIWANDTDDNWNATGIYNFTIADMDGPYLSNLNDFPDPQENGGYVNITVDLTDDIGADSAWVNVTYPDGSWANISMEKGQSDQFYFNTTYNDLGAYSYTIWANDTSDNWNKTGPGTFVIQDTDGPEFTNLNDSPDPQDRGGYVNVTVEVLDDVSVDEVWINITYPDSSWANISMEKGNGDEWFYNATYILLGAYSYTIWANDTSDNWNFTSPASFTIVDPGVPEFNDINDFPDPQENGGYVNITVDVTDVDGIDEVHINITYPDSTWVNISMIQGSGDEWYYNTTYGNLGIYSYTMWANDTNNNWNSTSPETFEIKANTNPPELWDQNDFPDPQVIGGFVNITVNVTDDDVVDEVWINITYSDGSWMNTTMQSEGGDGWYYNDTYLQSGIYSYTIWANDTFDNWNCTGPETFTIEDTTRPELKDLDDSPDPQKNGGYVNITVDVLDNVAVDSVWVNITYPDASWANISMDRGIGDEWYLNNTFMDVGVYSYTVWANDTSDNWNSTGPGSFTIEDNKGPELHNLDDSPDPQETGGYVNVTVDVTDDGAVVDVWINITYPDGSSVNVSMQPGSGDEWYLNTTYTELGSYFYIVWANDTANIWNSTGPGTFTIRDTDGPEFENLNDAPDPQVNGGYVNITVDVTDETALDTVWINITYPDGSWSNVSMKKGTGDEWYHNTTYIDLGGYSYVVWANDTLDNWNCTVLDTFDIKNEIVPPELFDLSDFPDPQEYGGYVNITLNVTDNTAVDEVWVNITYPDGSWVYLMMTKGIGDEWHYNTTYAVLGVCYYTVFANDSYNNWNSTGPGDFAIQDTISPEIINPNDSPDPQENDGFVNITVIARDNIAVNDVWVNITSPGGGYTNVSMQHVIGDDWFYNTNYSDLGSYSYTIYANDTSNNWNTTTPETFVIQDTDGPEFANLYDAPDPQKDGEKVNITVDVRDDIAVDSVWLNVTYPNGSSINVTMTKGSGDEYFYNITYFNAGLHTYTIYANDTLNNWNSTGPGTFEIKTDIDLPELMNVNDSPDPQEYGCNVNITVDVIDDIAVDEVWLNISYPNGTWAYMVMLKGTDDEWYHNTSYTLLGVFSYVISANDTSNNWNNSETGAFTIRDTIPPELDDLDVSPDPQENDGFVNITVDVTDEVSVNEVWINITYPNGSYVNTTMLPGLGDEWYFNDSYTDLGDHSYIIWANDSRSNLNNTEPVFFLIRDTDGPFLNNLIDSPDPQENGDSVTITVDVTDDVSVDTVWINITFPDGSTINDSMLPGTGDQWYYTKSFDELGDYFFIIHANDTSDNRDSAGPETFTIRDTDGPVINDLDDALDPQIVGGYVNITVNVTDDVAVDETWINITYPNSSWINVRMIKGMGIEWYYNASYDTLGNHLYIVTANDTNDNWNIADPGDFTIEETDQPQIDAPPEIDNLDETPDPQENAYFVNITVEVRDDVAVRRVWLNTTYPDGSWNNVSMVHDAGDMWYYNRTYHDLGVHSYMIWASDTMNHWNCSPPGAFTIHDKDGPLFFNLLDRPDPQEFGSYITITVDVIDDFNVQSVWINIYHPDETMVNTSMTSISEHGWSLIVAFTNLGEYIYKIWAIDANGNWNSTGAYTFTIQDTDAPEIRFPKVTLIPQEKGRDINITAVPTDEQGISEVWINITHQNGTWINVSMIRGPGSQWFFNDVFSGIGEYSYTIWAVDTSGNWNHSEPETFSIRTSELIPEPSKMLFMVLLFIYWPLLMILLMLVLVKRYEFGNRVKGDLIPIAIALNRIKTENPEVLKENLKTIQGIINLSVKTGIPVEESILAMITIDDIFQFEGSFPNRLIDGIIAFEAFTKIV